MFPARRKVALLVEVSNAYARGLLSGIIAYELRNAAWSVYLPEQQRRGMISVERIADWDVDGILARIETPQIADAIQRLGVPTVDLSAARLVPGIPWVETDNPAIAKLAADHLIDRGFSHFAFLGEEGFNWSKWRGKEFESYLKDRGIDCNSFQFRLTTDPDYSWRRESERLEQWVVSLPKPIGVFASYDIAAHRLLELARESGVAVPEELAVIGVDNDNLICDICYPSLTSIELDSFGTGYHAAKLLEQMMDGQDISTDAVFFPPIRIKERLSTDTVAVEDPHVAKALHFIRENAIFNISVKDVMKVVDVSRRQLEIRFNKIVGHTPHKEIQFRRMERVKHLVESTDLSVAKIAEQTGFRHAEYLSVAFSREVGCTILEYRRQHARDKSDI